MIEIIPNWHPLLVHFPVALLSVSAFFHLAAKVMQSKPRFASPCAVLAHATLWLGALAALPTAILGWQAFNSVNHDSAGHIAMLTHRAWALSTLAVLALVAGWDAWRNKVDASPAVPVIAAVLVAWVMVAITAWHGGELVYRHGLGVMALPAAEPGEGHHHVHGTEDEVHSHTDDAAPSTAQHEHTDTGHVH